MKQGLFPRRSLSSLLAAGTAFIVLVMAAISYATPIFHSVTNVFALRTLYAATNDETQLTYLLPMKAFIDINEPTSARWFGLAALIEGDYDLAARVASIKADSIASILVALIEVYGADLAALNAVFNDTLAAHLMDTYQADNDGHSDAAAEVLKLIARIRPYDLFVKFEQYKEGIVTRENIYTGFPASAVLSDSPQLRAWLARSFVQLYESGVWDKALTERIVQLWLWKYPDSQQTILLLSLLQEKWPDDPLWQDLERLSGIQDAPSPEMRTEAGLVRRTAELLKVNESAIKLGPNQFRNGAFEFWMGQEHPIDWSWSNMVGAPYFSDAWFIGGLQTGSNGLTLARIDGIWLKKGESLPRSARAGFWHINVQMPPGDTWAVQVTYKTSANCPDEAASLLLEQQNPVLFPEAFLPNTLGEWRSEVVLLQNHTAESLLIRPMVRNWAACTVWIERVTAYPILLREGFLTLSETTLTTWNALPIR